MARSLKGLLYGILGAHQPATMQLVADHALWLTINRRCILHTECQLMQCRSSR